MRVEVPKSVYDLPPGRLVVILLEPQVVLYLREDEWGMKKYPQRCPVDLRLGTWDIDNVLLVVLLLRLMRTDLTTFEFWVNAGDPGGVRLLQHLALQAEVDAHLVADQAVRSLHMTNSLRPGAATLVEAVRRRNAWTPAEFDHARDRMCQLYPTAHALWWNCQPPA